MSLDNCWLRKGGLFISPLTSLECLFIPSLPSFPDFLLTLTRCPRFISGFIGPNSSAAKSWHKYTVRVHSTLTYISLYISIISVYLKLQNTWLFSTYWLLTLRLWSEFSVCFAWCSWLQTFCWNIFLNTCHVHFAVSWSSKMGTLLKSHLDHWK